MLMCRISLAAIFLFCVCSRGEAVVKHTYTLEVAKGFYGSTEPPERRPSGFHPLSSNAGLIYMGSWGSLRKAKGWVRFDVPDFSTSGQEIQEVEIMIDVSGYNGGRPRPGLRITRVADDDWDASTIHHDWPVSRDSIIERREGGPTGDSDPLGQRITDITDWWGKGKEPLQGGEAFSICLTLYPQDYAWGMRMKCEDLKLRITTIPEAEMKYMLLLITGVIFLGCCRHYLWPKFFRYSRGGIPFSF